MWKLLRVRNNAIEYSAYFEKNIDCLYFEEFNIMVIF